MNSSEIRVRVAPSPTGLLHIGTAQSALFNWLTAKKLGGKFLVRIEDTDLERSEKRFEDAILESLKWLGLEWDELYHQRERAPIHRKYLEQLLAEKKAFYCGHSKEELEQDKLAHVCSHKTENFDTGIIRLNVPTGSKRKIHLHDIIRGDIEFEEGLLGDFSIAKSLDIPLFHFAVVVDDYEMQITHVIRGEDHLANTPKHILIQEALGFSRPQYAHLSLLLGPDRSKLSKRHGAVSVSMYRDEGFLPDAVVNYLAILGFTTSKEIISREELIQEFDLAKIHKSGAIFDIKKLEWINGEYIKKMTNEELLNTIGEKYKNILPMVRERMKKKADLQEFDFFFTAPSIDTELLKWKKASLEASKAMLVRVKEMIEKEGLEDLRAKLDELGVGDRGLVYWPLRVALTGLKASPDPVDIAVILGKEEVLNRITRAL